MTAQRTAPRLPALALTLALAGTLVLTGCTTETNPAPVAPVATNQPANVPAETDAPEVVEEPAEPEAPVADEYSQVIDGVLYRGTEKAPVRIGDDVPGRPPAAEAEFTREGWKEYAAEHDKYVVAVGEAPGEGWLWKVHGPSRFGGVRELGDSGYTRGDFLGSREAAVAGPFMVDGRELDRAEYILVVN